MKLAKLLLAQLYTACLTCRGSLALISHDARFVNISTTVLCKDHSYFWRDILYIVKVGDG